MQPPAPEALRSEHVAHLVDVVLSWIDREYPCWIGHELRGPDDVRLPVRLTPAFFGCYDWHSAVHSHWMLARLLRLLPGAAFEARAREVLDRHLTSDRLAAEAAFLGPRPTFERPYGLAWLLQLDAELAGWRDPDAARWRAALAPVVQIAARHLTTWMPRLSHAVRSGTHSQSAFALGLTLDWARETGAVGVAKLVEARALALHGDDRDFALHLEPSGEDFLSPALAAADLVRRVLPPSEFAAWLARALPSIPHGVDARWIAPVTDVVREDGRLSHHDGLNASRTFMLDGIAAGLPAADPRGPAIAAARHEHAAIAWQAVATPYEFGGHWLGSFAVYLVTARGLSGP